jgi:tRNA-dihydrouridine synthase 1
MMSDDDVPSPFLLGEKVFLAPMVRGTELAFRNVVRKYGVRTCYSPMLRASEVIRAYNDVWRKEQQEISDNDNVSSSRVYSHEDGMLLLTDILTDNQPLVVQLCGNCPKTLADATIVLLELQDHKNTTNTISGVDLNLGCPQKCASEGGFGAFLAEEHPDLAIQCVAAMRKAIDDCQPTLLKSKPPPRLSCKIRLLDDDTATIAFSQRLVEAGCELLTVHCRRRVDVRHDVKPDLEAGRRIVAALSPIPVVINGGSYTVDDVTNTLAITHAHAVMVARGFLENPRLLVQPQQHDISIDPAFLAVEYLDSAEESPPPSPLYIRMHLRWIFRSFLHPEQGYPESYEDWRPRLWTFLVRPYLETIDQFRQVVALYVKLNCSELPPSLRDFPDPSFQSIRHHRHSGKDIESLEEGEAMANLFQD